MSCFAAVEIDEKLILKAEMMAQKRTPLGRKRQLCGEERAFLEVMWLRVDKGNNSLIGNSRNSWEI